MGRVVGEWVGWVGVGDERVGRGLGRVSTSRVGKDAVFYFNPIADSCASMVSSDCRKL